MDQQFCLKWNNHKLTFLNLLEGLLQDENLVDVTLFASGKLVGAHKFVLSACSTYFEKIFAECGQKHPLIFLKDVSFEDLESLLEFMYRGEVNIMQDQLPGLIKTAEGLKIKGLAESVSDNSPCSNKSISNTVMPSSAGQNSSVIGGGIQTIGTLKEKKDNPVLMDCSMAASSPSSSSLDYEHCKENSLTANKIGNDWEPHFINKYQVKNAIKEECYDQDCTIDECINLSEDSDNKGAEDWHFHPLDSVDYEDSSHCPGSVNLIAI